MRTVPAYRSDRETARRARRGLAIYFAIVVALSAAVQAVVISRPDMDGLIAGLMLVPAVASVVTRLALKEGFSDVSFRLGERAAELREVGAGLLLAANAQKSGREL